MRRDSMRLRRQLVSEIPELKKIGNRLKVSVNLPEIRIELMTGLLTSEVEYIFNKIGVLSEHDRSLYRTIMRSILVFGQLRSVHYGSGPREEMLFIYMEE